MAAFAALRRAWTAAGGLHPQVHRTSVSLRGSQARTSFVPRLKSFPVVPWRLTIRSRSTAAVAGIQVVQGVSTPPLEDVLPLEELGQVVLQEPTLAELGLESYNPVGFILKLLESFHLDLGLPWWGAIVAGTVCIRCLVFPLIVKSQRDAIELNNHVPQMTALSARISEAKKTGNRQQFLQAVMDLEHYQKTHNINPLRGLITPLVQAPIFISFFFALRKMAECPVPSMQTGGLWWFTDLAAPDPYYILPVMVSVTMWIVTETGMQAGPPNPNLELMKKVFRVMPVVFLPFIISFPTAIFTYWLTSNFFSIMQILLFRLPAARTFFHIPERVTHNPTSVPPQEDFLKSIKEGWQNVQMAHQLNERQKYLKKQPDSTHKGSLHQTFSHRPSQHPSKPSPQKRDLG
ncbi:mitochondrial inner membrane protein OXA1L-like [Crotalus tigris]|uniref:mitochondrial inner membrane protein OXA1L-like n=1 Tax=Crotalus tigris TaxID=88082 RepID=UPI00192F69AD|nr:mitochondrial inner membrane protein OXA1L-like [Crotalus tigris]